MEQNAPILAKKVWNLVRILYLVIRKGIFKRKWMIDLNRMMKRGKIAGKAIQNLMQLHHHHHQDNNWAAIGNHLSFSTPPPGEYEFSCSNSPSTTYPFSLFSVNKKRNHYYSANTRQTTEDLDTMTLNAAVLKAMEMIHSETASPALPGFGRSPMVRQLRVTDSPFQLSCVDEDNHVDEAAEKFISRFYNDLRQQNTKASMIMC